MRGIGREGERVGGGGAHEGRKATSNRIEGNGRGKNYLEWHQL